MGGREEGGEKEYNCTHRSTVVLYPEPQMVPGIVFCYCTTCINTHTPAVGLAGGTIDQGLDEIQATKFPYTLKYIIYFLLLLSAKPLGSYEDTPIQLLYWY